MQGNLLYRVSFAQCLRFLAICKLVMNKRAIDSITNRMAVVSELTGHVISLNKILNKSLLNTPIVKWIGKLADVEILLLFID